MKYVSDDSHRLVLAMEQKFAALPPSAAVLFVSVSATPVEGGKVTTFSVRLGMPRHMTEDAGKTLVQHVLAEEMKMGLHIYAAVYRGVLGMGGRETTKAVAIRS